jgi:hypothetical protein
VANSASSSKCSAGHQLVGQGAHARHELLDERTESRQRLLGQPLVGAVEAQVGGQDVGCIDRVLRGDVELLELIAKDPQAFFLK